MRQTQGKISPYLSDSDRQSIKANDGLFSFCDVIIQRPDRQAISLIQENLLVEVGQISTEFEDRFSEFTVGSVSIKVSNFTNQLDLNNPDSYFYKLSKDEIVSVTIYLQMEKNYPIFKGILSQTESTFNIDSDEGTLYAEGEIKKFSNVSAEQMWGEDDKHRFKHVVDVVNKCVEEMATETAQPMQSIVKEPSLISEDRTFSYYDKTDSDEPVQSIAVDEDGILYLMTEKKIYSFNPTTREKKLIYTQSSSLYKNHKMVYYNGYLFFLGEWGTSGLFPYRLKKDGSDLDQVWNFPLPGINETFESKQFDYHVGTGNPDFPFRFYSMQLVGWYKTRVLSVLQGPKITISKYAYVDFAYLEGDSAPVGTESPFSWPGGNTYPTTEQKVRVYRNFYKTYRHPEWGNMQILIQQYYGVLPMNLPPGEYSFVSYPSSVDFAYNVIMEIKDGVMYSYYPEWNPNEVPRKFKIVVKEEPNLSMIFCNGFLLFPVRKSITDQPIQIVVQNPVNLAQYWIIDLSQPCISEDICLYVENDHLFIAYTTKDGCILEEMVINGFDDVTKIKTEILLDDAKTTVRDFARIGTKSVAIFEYKSLPNFIETIHNIGDRVDQAYLDPSSQQTWPADMPCHADVVIWHIPLFFSLPLDQYWDDPGDSWYLAIGLQGDFREEKSEFNKVDYFSDSDLILIVPSGSDENIYKWEIAPITEVVYDTGQNIYLISRTRIKVPLFESLYPQTNNGSKIYKSCGKLPPLRFVKAGKDIRYNYTLVEKEEKTVEAYTLREKAEPVKLTNKYAVIDDSFKITFENGKEIPSSDYEIQENKGTDYDEMWIYFGPVYFGKKILITYNYVDPEKKFLNLTVTHNKVYFIETGTDGAKLISYDGTAFKEEGLTYIEQQPDHSYKTLTEVIKPKETGINSNLIYCSKNDRIYGITSPNDFVLFQFAKDISLYIEDVYFQDRNCVQILDECAKASGFIICMDNFGKLHFVSREYFSRMYPENLDEDTIIDLQTRQASYEFGDRYDVITVQYPNGEEAVGEGRLKYTIGSSVISSRGWARALANFSYDYLSQDRQTHIVKTKAFYDLWLLNNIPVIFPEKSISALTKVHSMTLNPSDLTLEITTREVKGL
jgi:hypothetical protein